MKPEEEDLLIAPCGMNCGICLAYLRPKNKCKGCRSEIDGKPVTRVNCRIKKCEKQNEFCLDCDVFPCSRLKQLDKRYRLKYKMSMIENLLFIKENGLQDFVKKEKDRWICLNCGGTICVHKGYCIACPN